MSSGEAQQSCGFGLRTFPLHNGCQDLEDIQFALAQGARGFLAAAGRHVSSLPGAKRTFLMGGMRTFLLGYDARSPGR